MTNIGDASGVFALGSTGLTDSSLSRELDLAVQDVTVGDDPALVYSGKLASLSSVALGSMAQGEAHRYRFSISLPSDAGDIYQGASSAVTLIWSATATEPDEAPAPDPGEAPAPARTAEVPPAVAAAGGIVRPRATLTASARQRAAQGTVELGWRARPAAAPC